MEKERIERVKKMEGILDHLTEVHTHLEGVLLEWRDALPEYNELVSYYMNEEWQKDFDDSNAGLFPKDLPQGVLTEDLIYNTMVEQRDLAMRLARLSLDVMEQA